MNSFVGFALKIVTDINFSPYQPTVKDGELFFFVAFFLMRY